jgi:CubicO group peptidase (beta-lactamase class C family)
LDDEFVAANIIRRMPVRQSLAGTRRPITVPLVAVAFVTIALAAPVITGQRSSRFDLVVETARRELQETHTPGAAIAVIEGDRVTFATGVGVADVETAAPVRPEMLFRLGSTTKMFTATALVTLAEEGKVSLDAPIGGVVSGLDPAIARLTPNQLLSHTAGLRDDAQMFGRHDDEALGSEIRAMRATAFFTEPGAIYSYANPGFWIAGFLIEQITGKPFADAMQERLFTPLGMSRSTFRPTLAMTFPLAQGHEASPSKPPAVIRPAADNVANWPAGSMFSSAQDLSRYIAAFMNDGRIDGRQALLPAVIAKLSTPHAPIPGGDSSYGYGLSLSERQGIRIVQHGGSRSGYGSTIIMAPARHVGVVVLGNRSGSGLPKTADRAMELLLDVPAGSLSAQRSETSPAAIARDMVPWAPWIGRYTQGPGPAIEIVMKDGHLVCHDGTRELDGVPSGALQLSVSGGDGAQPSTWILVPDRDGKPAYVFRGSRAFKRVER